MSLEQLAAFAIRMYQKYISPYKGFRCAHRVLHGGPSCSEFARLYVQEHTLWAMFPALRLRECRMAKETLSAEGAISGNEANKDPTPLWCDLCGGLGDMGANCGCGAAAGACSSPVDACDCPCG